MATTYLAKETLRALFMPPGLLVFVLIIGIGLWPRQAGKRLVALSTACLYLLSTPLIAGCLMAAIEAPSLPVNADIRHIDAIICLGGGKRLGAYDLPAGETINHETLARLRQTARLQRHSFKPVLVTGGAPAGGIAEAILMQQALESDFRIPVRWVEANSSDTRDNATMSAAILLPAHRHILLVSSAYHLPRAQRAFEAAGFRVTPAPSDYTNREPFSYLSLLPRASAFRTTSTALRELAGSVWYRLRQ